MNIFEYLGLEADHRKTANKVTQLVKHWDEVTDKHKDCLQKDFFTQTKKDGVCSIVLIWDGFVTIWSRTGKKFTNTSYLVENIKSLNLNDGCYLGEMLLPKEVASLEEVSGMVNPNRIEKLDKRRAALVRDLEMHFFDMIPLDDFIRGVCDLEFRHRIRSLYTAIPLQTRHVKVCRATAVTHMADINLDFDTEVASGEEGIIIRDGNADWLAGHKGYRVMKMVRGVDYDLECIGYEEGTGKYVGKVANLLFKWKDGKVIKAMLGKGWTHEAAEQMFEAIHYGESVGMEQYTHKDSPIGKIFQVYALEESSKGVLRLPKVGERRHDKEETDV